MENNQDTMPTGPDGSPAVPETSVADSQAASEDSTVKPDAPPLPQSDSLGFQSVKSAELRAIEDLSELVEQRLMYDEAKERAINKLVEEVNLYRDNFVLQSQKPLLIELIMLYDNLESILHYLEPQQDMPKEQVQTITNNLGTLKQELLEVLYRRSVVPFDHHPEVLDHKLHRTVKTVQTSNQLEHNKVDRIVKVGFTWGEKLLRPEEVIIKKHIPPKE